MVFVEKKVIIAVFPLLQNGCAWVCFYTRSCLYGMLQTYVMYAYIHVSYMLQTCVMYAYIHVCRTCYRPVWGIYVFVVHVTGTMRCPQRFWWCGHYGVCWEVDKTGHVKSYHRGQATRQRHNTATEGKWVAFLPHPPSPSYDIRDNTAAKVKGAPPTLS